MSGIDKPEAQANGKGDEGAAGVQSRVLAEQERDGVFKAAKDSAGKEFPVSNFPSPKYDVFRNLAERDYTAKHKQGDPLSESAAADLKLIRQFADPYYKDYWSSIEEHIRTQGGRFGKSEEYEKFSALTRFPQPQDEAFRELAKKYPGYSMDIKPEDTGSTAKDKAKLASKREFGEPEDEEYRAIAESDILTKAKRGEPLSWSDSAKLASKREFRHPADSHYRLLAEKELRANPPKDSNEKPGPQLLDEENADLYSKREFGRADNAPVYTDLAKRAWLAAVGKGDPLSPQDFAKLEIKRQWGYATYGPHQLDERRLLINLGVKDAKSLSPAEAAKLAVKEMRGVSYQDPDNDLRIKAYLALEKSFTPEELAQWVTSQQHPGYQYHFGHGGTDKPMPQAEWLAAIGEGKPPDLSNSNNLDDFAQLQTLREFPRPERWEWPPAQSPVGYYYFSKPEDYDKVARIAKAECQILLSQGKRNTVPITSQDLKQLAPYRAARQRIPAS